MKTTVVVTVAAIVLALSSSAYAHHSYAQFLDQPITLEGRLERIEFTNPHTLLTVRDTGDRIYTIIWNAAFQLHSMGVKPTDLNVGDVVALTGYPSRDPEARQMAKLRKVRRLSDGWTWQILNGQATVGRLLR